MRDNSGYTNWETERMFFYAQKFYKHKRSFQKYFERMVNDLRHIEGRILIEGRKSFSLYLQDPVNYWEVYGRLCQEEFIK